MPQPFILYGGDEKLERANDGACTLFPDLRKPGSRLATVDGFLDFMFSRRHAPSPVSESSAITGGRHDFREVVDCGDRTCMVQACQLESGGLLVLFTDITAFCTQQSELQRLTRENRELLEALEAAPNGIVIADARRPGWPLIFANGAFCRKTGREKSAVTGADWSAVFGQAAVLGDAMADGRVFEWKDGDGACAFWFELAVSPVFDKAGRQEFVVGVLADKTQAKNQEIHFAQIQKMEALGQLAGGVAHDFNNLLSIIGGYVRMARKESGGGEVLVSYLDRIDTAVRRGAGLTRQLLSFGQHKIVSSKAVDIGAFVQEQESLLLPLVDPSIGIRIAAEKGMFAECAPDGLAQAVMNLVVNSRDAMPDGGTISIDVREVSAAQIRSLVRSEDRDRNFVCVDVTDTGTGISPEIAARIFDPFFTTKEPGKGTGLGLSLVYGTVRQAGGYIDVSSGHGGGTSIRLYFPVCAPAAVKAISETAGDGGRPGTVRFDGYTALVVDDEREILDIVCRMMEDAGMKVIAAGGGDDALEKQDGYEGDIDILLTDVVMPGISGVRLAELMHEVRPETKAVFMSGYPAAGHLARVQVAEDALLLAKPVEYEKLMHLVKTVLEGDLSAVSKDKGMDRWRAASG